MGVITIENKKRWARLIAVVVASLVLSVYLAGLYILIKSNGLSISTAIKTPVSEALSILFSSFNNIKYILFIEMLIAAFLFIVLLKSHKLKAQESEQTTENTQDISTDLTTQQAVAQSSIYRQHIGDGEKITMVPPQTNAKNLVIISAGGLEKPLCYIDSISSVSWSVSEAGTVVNIVISDDDANELIARCGEEPLACTGKIELENGDIFFNIYNSLGEKINSKKLS